MKLLACIIFDLDGTLTQTNELIFASFNHVAKKYRGITYSPEEIIAMFGPPEDVAIEKIVGTDRRDAAMNDFYSFYAEHHATMAHLHDGVKELLADVKARGFILALFTGKGKQTTLITLQQFGIQHYFDLLITGHDVQKYKPSADGIRKVLARFGLDPGEVLMVGDAVSDVTAAHEAGVEIAAVLWDSYGKEKVLAMDVDYTFHRVAEFASWLKNSTQSKPLRNT